MSESASPTSSQAGPTATGAGTTDGSAPDTAHDGTGIPTPPPAAPESDERWSRLVQNIARGNLLVVVLSFVFAFLIGSVLIVIADDDVRETLGYFFARPTDAVTAIWQSITQAYGAMFRGAVFDGPGFSRRLDSLREAGGSGTYVLFPALAVGLRPLTETLTVATPLIIASAGLAVGFRAGLFNIGGNGQLIVGAMAAGYIGFSVDLPVGIHLLVCLLAGLLAGGIWGGIAGFLKARFGANEVISTIMLNWIATYLLFFALKTTVFTGANKSQPTSPSILDSAQLPSLLGSQFRLHLGLFVAAGAAVLLWWLMSRSTIGFHFRAVGSNPRAAQVAGISPARTAFLVMAVSGALVGLAGAVHVLGTERRLTEGVAGSIGFDAITVALLGRSGPVGIVLAGLLFAGLSTGGRFMETNQGVPLDLVQVIQALVVLFIAAPPLVRTLVGLRRVDNPALASRRRSKRAAQKALTTGRVTPPETGSATETEVGTTRGDATHRTGDTTGGLGAAASQDDRPPASPPDSPPRTADGTDQDSRKGEER